MSRKQTVIRINEPDVDRLTWRGTRSWVLPRVNINLRSDQGALSRAAGRILITQDAIRWYRKGDSSSSSRELLLPSRLKATLRSTVMK